MNGIGAGFVDEFYRIIFQFIYKLDQSMSQILYQQLLHWVTKTKVTNPMLRGWDLVAFIPLKRDNSTKSYVSCQTSKNQYKLI